MLGLLGHDIGHIYLLRIHSNELLLLLLLLLTRAHYLFSAFGTHNVIRIGHPLCFDRHVPGIVWHRHSKLTTSLVDLVSQVKAFHLVSVRTQTIERRDSRAVHLCFVHKIISHFWGWVENHVFIVQNWQDVRFNLHTWHLLWHFSQPRLPLHLYLIKSKYLALPWSVAIGPILCNTSLYCLLPNCSKRS